MCTPSLCVCLSPSRSSVSPVLALVKFTSPGYVSVSESKEQMDRQIPQARGEHFQLSHFAPPSLLHVTVPSLVPLESLIQMIRSMFTDLRYHQSIIHQCKEQGEL